MSEVGKAFGRCGIVLYVLKSVWFLLVSMLQSLNHGILVCSYCFNRAYLDEFLHKHF